MIPMIRSFEENTDQPLKKEKRILQVKEEAFAKAKKQYVFLGTASNLVLIEHSV